MNSATLSSPQSPLSSQGKRTPFDWHETADVIVIGAGCAGLMAAIRARREGASVLVLEKMAACGGNSIISGGLLAAAGTRLQARHGISDSPERMLSDMEKAGRGLTVTPLARIVADRSADMLHWTIDTLGMEYLDRLAQLGGHSAPRTHILAGRTGNALVRRQVEQARNLGAEIRTGVYLESILRGADGRVIGVRARIGYRFPDPASGSTVNYRADRAAVLASGGFGADPSFLEAQDPRLGTQADTTNKRCATSEGLKAALRVGAMPVQLGCIQLLPDTSPDEKGEGVAPGFAENAFRNGMIVDPVTGGRCVNELADRKTLADAIRHAGRPGLCLTDQRGFDRAPYPLDHCLKKGVVRSFANLAELAAAYDLPAEDLYETVRRYNRSVQEGLDRDFDKPIPADARPVEQPPFYAMRLWPKVHHTMGGLAIDTQARVLDLDGRPIPGLYAAGEVTGGIHGACRLGSCALTESLIFGDIAGHGAATQPRALPYCGLHHADPAP